VYVVFINPPPSRTVFTPEDEVPLPEVPLIADLEPFEGALVSPLSCVGLEDPVGVGVALGDFDGEDVDIGPGTEVAAGVGVGVEAGEARAGLATKEAATVAATARPVSRKRAK
jgi:hypothetical protein